MKSMLLSIAKRTCVFFLSAVPFCLTAQTNKVAKFTSTTMPSGLNQSQIFDNGTNVGIGTTTPLFKTEIIGTATAPSTGSTANGTIGIGGAGTNGILNMGVDFTTGSYSWIQSRNRSSANFYNLALNPNGGNVGIGTGSPKAKLEVLVPGCSTQMTLGSSTGIGFGVTTGSYGLYTGVSCDGKSWLQGGRTDGNNTPYNISLQAAGGNVGIGTAAPTAKLEISGIDNLLKLVNVPGSTTPLYLYSGSGSSNGSGIYMYTTGRGSAADLTNLITNWGGNYFWNFGSGTGDFSAARLTVGGSGTKESNYGMFILTKPGQDNGIFLAGAGNSFFNGTGNVLIGKNTQTNAAYKLDVAGAIRANEVVVNTTGADFVFEENYKLRKLEEVEKFIKENKHLPEIAPAQEMSCNGVSVGELNTKLLQKVEELTLYLIEANKAMNEANKRIATLEKQIKE